MSVSVSPKLMESLLNYRSDAYGFQELERCGFTSPQIEIICKAVKRHYFDELDAYKSQYDILSSKLDCKTETLEARWNHICYSLMGYECGLTRHDRVKIKCGRYAGQKGIVNTSDRVIAEVIISQFPGSSIIATLPSWHLEKIPSDIRLWDVVQVICGFYMDTVAQVTHVGDNEMLHLQRVNSKQDSLYYEREFIVNAKTCIKLPTYKDFTVDDEIEVRFGTHVGRTGVVKGLKKEYSTTLVLVQLDGLPSTLTLSAWNLRKITHEEETITQENCTCQIDTLMSHGCQCGHLKRENND